MRFTVFVLICLLGASEWAAGDNEKREKPEPPVTNVTNVTNVNVDYDRVRSYAALAASLDGLIADEGKTRLTGSATHLDGENAFGMVANHRFSGQFDPTVGLGIASDDSFDDTLIRIQGSVQF